MRGGFASPAKGKDVVLLKKELMEAVLLKPSRGGDALVGAVFVSIGGSFACLACYEAGSDARQGERTQLATGWTCRDVRACLKRSGQLAG